eukprot:65651_1
MAMQKYIEYAQSELISQNEMESYRKQYYKVLAAVNNIPPKSRIIKKSHEVVVCEHGQLDEVAVVLAQSCAVDVGCDNNFNDKLKRVVNMAKIKAKPYNQMYSSIKISGEWGGKSDCTFALIGMKKAKNNEFAIGVSMYSETWVEEDNVKINLSNAIWSDENVSKFLRYQLYTQLNNEMEKACIEL